MKVAVNRPGKFSRSKQSRSNNMLDWDIVVLRPECVKQIRLLPFCGPPRQGVQVPTICHFLLGVYYFLELKMGWVFDFEAVTLTGTDKQRRSGRFSCRHWVLE